MSRARVEGPVGRSPSGPGCQPTASAADASSQSGIPNAWLPYALDESHYTERGAGFIEGFAAACASVSHALVGEPDAGKSYDPMTVDRRRGTMFSYVFDMKDGTRQHPLCDYSSLQEIADCLLAETLLRIQHSDLCVEDLLPLLNAAASAMSAGTAETGTGSGLQPASAAPKADAPPPSPPSQR